MLIKEKLKYLRKLDKYTQQQVADAINVDRVSYTRYENGSRTPTAEIIVSLANFFDCTTDYLLGKTDEPNLVQWTDLPKELTDEGFEAIEIVKDALSDGLSVDDLKEIVALAKKLKKDNNLD